jgi:hypothetical protein
MKKLPKIEGLVSYRSDKRKLYFRGNSKWNAIGKQDEVSKEFHKINACI